jgi:hypothetical protein
MLTFYLHQVLEVLREKAHCEKSKRKIIIIKVTKPVVPPPHCPQGGGQAAGQEGLRPCRWGLFLLGERIDLYLFEAEEARKPFLFPLACEQQCWSASLRHCSQLNQLCGCRLLSLVLVSLILPLH